MKIGEVAGNVELGDLPLSVGKVLGASKPARKQKDRFVELLAFADHRLALLNLDDVRDEAADCLLLFGADAVACAELLEMSLDHGLA
jgi:hypothetical protein